MAASLMRNVFHFAIHKPIVEALLGRQSAFKILDGMAPGFVGILEGIKSPEKEFIICFEACDQKVQVFNWLGRFVFAHLAFFSVLVGNSASLTWLWHVHLVVHEVSWSCDLHVETVHNVGRTFHALKNFGFRASVVGCFPFGGVLVADVGPAVARIVIRTEATMRKVGRKSSKHLCVVVSTELKY